MFHIREDNRDLTLKTETSKRSTPLHSGLIEAGFLAYVQGLIAEHGHGAPLFPMVAPARKYRKRGDNASKIMGPWLRKVVGITDPLKVFHSWRATLKTLARDHGIEEQYSDALSGHMNVAMTADGRFKGTGSIGRRYGEYKMTTLSRELEKLPVFTPHEEDDEVALVAE